MGSKNGRFATTYPSGDRYRGDFVDGLRHGYGVYLSRNGACYTGQWQNDQRAGVGRLTYSDSKGAWAGTYHGGWKENRRHGSGTFAHANGDVVHCQWEGGQKNGAAIYAYANGDVLVGSFKDDEIEGAGVFYYDDGSSLAATFAADLPVGRAVLTLADGKRFEELWENGKRVSKTPIGAADEPTMQAIRRAVAEARASIAKAKQSTMGKDAAGLEAMPMEEEVGQEIQLTEEDLAANPKYQRRRMSDDISAAASPPPSRKDSNPLDDGVDDLVTESFEMTRRKLDGEDEDEEEEENGADAEVEVEEEEGDDDADAGVDAQVEIEDDDEEEEEEENGEEQS